MENWKDKYWPFEEFNEEKTQTWIKNSIFTQKEARKWLEAGILDDESYLVLWLKNNKKIEISEWKDLNPNERSNLRNRFKESYKFPNYCKQCWKMLSEKSTPGFCSENCQINWKDNEEILEWQKKVDENFNWDRIKEWKKLNFTLADAQQWNNLGFSTYDSQLATNWRDIWRDTLDDTLILEQVHHWVQELELDRFKFQQVHYWKRNSIRPVDQTELKQLKEQGISAQKLVDLLYPQNSVCLFNDSNNNQGKNRAQITELNLRMLNLTDSLNLSDFINLEKLDCWINQLNSLELNHCVELKELNCSNNKLTLLEIKDCLNLKELKASNNELIILNLSKQTKLKELNCSNNQLDEIILPLNNQLKEINLSYNLLNFFYYSLLNPTTLTNLNLSNNRLAETNIEFFEDLINLEHLTIGNNQKEKNQEEIYKNFVSWSRSLKTFTRLRKLNINNIDINVRSENYIEF